MIDHKKLKSALQTLDSAPKAISRAKSEYTSKMQGIRELERSGRYSPNYIKQAQDTARREKDRTVKAMAESMISALQTVRENNDYTGEALSLDDPKLTNALNITSMLGKKMPAATQANILAQFRGNPAALSVLEGAYRQNGLYFADMAHEMQRPINTQAMDEMERCLAGYVYNQKAHGVFDVDFAPATWTMGDFAKQAQRLGYDLSDESAYSFALNEELRRLDEASFKTEDPSARAAIFAQRTAILKAQREVTEARAAGKDEAAAFEHGLAQVERLGGYAGDQGGE